MKSINSTLQWIFTVRKVEKFAEWFIIVGHKIYSLVQIFLIFKLIQWKNVLSKKKKKKKEINR